MVSNFYFLNSQSGHTLERNANSLVTSDRGPKTPDTKVAKAGLDIASSLENWSVLLAERIQIATTVDAAH